MGYPIVWQIVTSFQKYGALQQLGGKAPDFVGLDNYIAVATSPTFWEVGDPLDRSSASSRRSSRSCSACCCRC